MPKPDSNYSNKEFKLRGSIVLSLYDNECAICNNVKDWMEIHHIDRQNDNNAWTNLIPVCKDCHMIVHSKRFTIKLIVDERVLKAARMIEEIMKSSPRKI